MPEGVAEDQGTDPELFGLAGEPRVGDHRLEHGLALRQGRSQVIHAGDAGEPRRLRRAGAVDELVHGQPHLRQKEPELEWARHGQLLVSTRRGETWTGCRHNPATRGPEDIYGSPKGHNRSGPGRQRRRPGRPARRTMKAVRSVEGGVALVDLDEPPGTGELLDMQATSICGSDLSYIRFGSRAILGHELAGVPRGRHAGGRRGHLRLYGVPPVCAGRLQPVPDPRAACARHQRRRWHGRAVPCAGGPVGPPPAGVRRP